MLPDTHIKEFLSQSYLSAVAAQAGYGCEIHKQDYGVDATITEMQKIKNGKLSPSGFQYDVQLKSTHNFERNNQDVVYVLEAEAYNKLVSRRTGLIILVLFCVPEHPNDRLSLSEDQLELRNCCYWTRIVGNYTENSKSVTVHIPRIQVFNPGNCKILMESVKSGTLI